MSSNSKASHHLSMKANFFRHLPSFPCPVWWRVAIGCWCAALIGSAQAQDGNTLNTAYPLGPLNAALTRGGSVSNASPADFYQFAIPIGPVREVVAHIAASSLTSGLELSLARDANGDGIEDVLVSSLGYGPPGLGARDARVSLWLDPGTYYVRVAQDGPNTSTGYTLSLSATNRPASPGNNDNSRATARTLTTGQPITDFVGTNDFADYYQFIVTGEVTAVTGRVAAASLSGSVQLSLLRNDDLLVSDLGYGPPGIGGNDAEVWLWLDPGTYYLRVETADAYNNTTYAVDLFQSARPESQGTNDNSRATARLFTPGQPYTDFVGINDIADYHRFVVTEPSTDVTLLVPGDTLQAGIRLTLLDANGTDLAFDDGFGPSFADDAFVSYTLSPGTYYARIEPAGLDHNTTYLLGISGPPQPPLPGIGLSGYLGFGNVDVGSTATRALIINNPGTDTLNVSDINYPSGFSGSFSGAVAPGGSTNVTVTFAPVSAGTNRGALTVISDAASGVNTTVVEGFGATRVIALSGPLQFGNVESMQLSNRTLTITNRGNLPLTVIGLTFPEGFSGGFSGEIAPGARTNVMVTFAPTNVASYGGTVEVLSDRTSGANTTTVSGTGTVFRTRYIALLGDLNFGAVEVGRSSNRVLVITNVGEAPFTVTGISLPEYFTGSLTPGELPRFGWRAVSVTFSPLYTNILSYGGLVTVDSPDANGGTNTIQASGTATPELSRIIGLSGNLAFGDVKIRTSAKRLMLITNSGAGTLLISSINFPAGFSGAFSGEIPPGKSTNVMVTFSPQFTTNYSGLITVHSDANGGMNTLGVSGTGAAAPLRAVAGLYQGLFRQPDAVRHASSGFFTLTVSKDGASYSARILLEGQVLKTSGKLNYDGSATNVIKRRKGMDSITVEWHADLRGEDQVTGSIGAAYWNAELLGHRAVFTSKTHDAPQAGRYTMRLPGVFGDDRLPQGDGVGAVSISARGVITLAGSLADGTKVTQSANLSSHGDWPLYLSLYGGGGSLWARATVANSPASDLGGELTWNRPAMKKTIYPSGFSEVRSEITGWRYQPPADKSERVVAITNAILSFTGGSFASPLDCRVVLGLGNKVTNLSPHLLKMTIDPKSGLFSGTLTEAGTTAKLPFQGAFFQPIGAAGGGTGWFLRENLGGRIEFRAAP